MLTFNTDGMIRQSFPFTDPIIDYILKNLLPQHLIKLYQCSKIFYANFRKNIIRHLEIVDDDEPQIFDPTKTIICISNPALQDLQHFWITDSLIHGGPIGILPFFSNCTVKKLELCEYILSSEFEYLTKAETVQDLKIKGIFCYVAGLIPIENIIARVPNASSIEISESIITPTTFELLLSLNHKAKISNFVLKNLTSPSFYKHDLLASFLLKNAVENCNIHFDFEKYPDLNGEWREINERIENIGKEGYELMIRYLKLKFSAQKIAHAESMFNP